MVLIIDPQVAGISGDMMLSSLIDLGAKKSKIINGAYESENYLRGSKIKKIQFTKINKHGIWATQLVLKLDEDHHHRKAAEIQKCIQSTAKKLGLSEKAQNFTTGSINLLVSAESKIHGVPKNQVHFHEAASIDTVVDIVGTAVALDDLGCFDEQIVTMPVCVGSGFVSFSHGTVSNPAGAILGIFEKSGIIIKGNSVQDELTTPTGAAMLVNLTNRCMQYYPPIKVDGTGYGAGKKNFEGFSNVLKVVRGSLSNYESDVVTVLETNVDDVTGETISYVIDKIMAAGAKDVSVISAVTKKGRPSYIISAICTPDLIEPILDVLVLETGTLGVRVKTTERYVVPRHTLKIPVKVGSNNFVVRCKITKNQFKIDHDDIKSVAQKSSITLKQAKDLLNSQIKSKLK